MLQNRVNPWGELLAVPDRGLLMGNRGILHDDQNRIVRPWAHKSWVTCLLSYKDIKRPKPFSPGNYSELFFLDEATAFAAGHRPCTFCQRDRSGSFKAAWLTANVPEVSQSAYGMSEIDALLHKQRAIRGGAKVTYWEDVSSLPIGTMFAYGGIAYLVSVLGFLPWSFSGYGQRVDLPSATIVSVLTPRSVVAAFQRGFEPRVHASAGK